MIRWGTTAALILGAVAPARSRLPVGPRLVSLRLETHDDALLHAR